MRKTDQSQAIWARGMRKTDQSQAMLGLLSTVALPPARRQRQRTGEQGGRRLTRSRGSRLAAAAARLMR